MKPKVFLNESQSTAQTIGEKIKELRLYYDMTQTYVATSLGVSKSVVSAYEKGIRTPSYDMFIKMGKFFQVNPSYFLSSPKETNIDDFKTNELIDVSNLTIKQRKLINDIVKEFEKINSSKKEG